MRAWNHIKCFHLSLKTTLWSRYYNYFTDEKADSERLSNMTKEHRAVRTGGLPRSFLLRSPRPGQLECSYGPLSWTLSSFIF